MVGSRIIIPIIRHFSRLGLGGTRLPPSLTRRARATTKTFASRAAPKSTRQCATPSDFGYTCKYSGICRQSVFSVCLPGASQPSTPAIGSRIARLLNAEREKTGLSLNVVAQKAGLSRQTVSYVEQEVQSPTLAPQGRRDRPAPYAGFEARRSQKIS